jgi:hypothetical protein
MRSPRARLGTRPSAVRRRTPRAGQQRECPSSARRRKRIIEGAISCPPMQSIGFCAQDMKPSIAALATARVSYLDKTHAQRRLDPARSSLAARWRFPSAIPFLGWGNWIVLPIAHPGAGLGALSSKNGGRNFCLIVLLTRCPAEPGRRISLAASRRGLGEQSGQAAPSLKISNRPPLAAALARPALATHRSSRSKVSESHGGPVRAVRRHHRHTSHRRARSSRRRAGARIPPKHAPGGASDHQHRAVALDPLKAVPACAAAWPSWASFDRGSARARAPRVRDAICAPAETQQAARRPCAWQTSSRRGPSAPGRKSP